MLNTRLLGAMGEQTAARYLRSMGYTIVAANYKTKVGEIDIVAERDGFICFVEVKTRKDNGYLPPSAAVGADKERHIEDSARIYMNVHKPLLTPRFDIIEVYTVDGKPVRINHIENAF